MLVGCVSFDCHPRLPFFSHQRRMLLSRLCLLLLTPLALSLQKATPVPITTLALSPQKVTHLIYVLRCPRQPIPFAANSSARSVTLTFAPQKASVVAGRPAACATTKGARGDVDHAILHAVAATVTRPLILLLGRARLV
jgi:hypothetical protein